MKKLSPFLILLFLLPCFGLSAEYHFVANSRYVSIYGSKQTPQSTLQLRQLLDAGIDEIQLHTGIYLEGGPDIYIVSSDKAYEELVKSHGHIVEFSDAFYSSASQKIWTRPIQRLGSNYIKILLHEYMHWYLDQLFEGATLWFHEGMACLFANQLGLESYVSFTRDCFMDKPADLFVMSYQYPKQASQWQTYYLSSLFAVSYLKDKKPQGWARFWAQTSANQKAGNKTLFVRTFNSSFHTTLFDFNLEYRAHLKQKAWQYLLIGFNSIIFSLLPFLLLFIYLKRRRRMKRLPDLPMPEDNQASETLEED